MREAMCNRAKGLLGDKQRNKRNSEEVVKEKQQVDGGKRGMDRKKGGSIDN